MVALGRIGETEDDELAYAYFSANGGGQVYDRKRWSRAYLARASQYYRRKHVQRAVSMTLKAAGLAPQGVLSRWLAAFGYHLIRLRARRPMSA